ncbi:Ycf54-like superfamily [Sesbania bispinosa]|nr:Ycf54-like superfamily [Sesbania bispinosa]
MLGMATLTLGSSAAMVAQSQAQHATTLACTNALPGSKRHSLSNRTHSLPMGLVSPTNQNCTLLSSFKKPTPVPPFTTAVASVDSDNVSSSDDPATKNEANKYYFVVANAKFMLDEEEHFKELLFERRRYYEERDKNRISGLSLSLSSWINSLTLPRGYGDLLLLLCQPMVPGSLAVINYERRSCHLSYMDLNSLLFMKLRLDRVLSESFEAESLDEALASNPTNLEFEKPEKWVAPYPKYEFGWWEPFLPSGHKEVKS